MTVCARSYASDIMHTMFSIVAISFDEFKRHFTSVEGSQTKRLLLRTNVYCCEHVFMLFSPSDTASILVWVDSQLQQVCAGDGDGAGAGASAGASAGDGDGYHKV
jgi:hypothetical protein